MSFYSTEPTKVLVIGGTGTQGQCVVRELIKDGKYLVTILTRSIETPPAKALQDLGKVVLIEGSYQVEEDVRKALKDQNGVYMNLDSFTMSESAEYYWSFRIYELAVQSGVKHFVYSTLNNWPKAHNYAEEFRVTHTVTKGRIGEWLSTQPTSILPWTILVGSIYTEMLSMNLAPSVDPDGTFVFAAPSGNGAFLFTDLAQYGHFARWIFDNPNRSIGQYISLGPYAATLDDIAKTFTKVTGKKARSATFTLDEWFEREASRGIPVDRKLPFIDSDDGKEDDTRFTFRQRFTGFYNVWKAMTAEKINKFPNRGLVDEICPPSVRITSLEEWMQVTGYTGEHKKV